MSTQTDDLLVYLFDGQPNPLVQPMAAWLASSRRFAAFVTAFRDKIRKKLRTTQDPNSLLDLQLELETAYLLLRERALSLAYEPEQSRGARSPDFAVTFTTSLTFMLEVTRLQAERSSRAGERPASPPAGARLADAVLSKLGQLLPQRGNLLLAAVEGAPLTPDELRSAMLGMQQRAERNDPTVVEGRGFLDRTDFFRHYQRLSEILVRVPSVGAAGSIVAWVNPQAKYPLPGRVRTALYRGLSG